jgi:HD-GYP domain-containing protein (c-di-GMP phosphodiesterase class II)
MGAAMSESPKMRPAVRLYVAANVAGALAIAVFCLRRPENYPMQLVFFLLLLPARQLTLRATAGGPSLSLGAVFTVASFVLLGPYGAICAIATTVWPRPVVPLTKRLFNGSEWMIAWFAAGWAFWLAGGHWEHLTRPDTPVADDVLPLLAGLVTLTVVNIVLLTFVMVLSREPRAWGMLKLLWSSSNIWQILIAIVAFMVVDVGMRTGGAAVVVLILLPIVVAQVAISRAEIAERNHQATLQALATALETKDPYTRGHGERVGKGAFAVAKHLDWRPERTEMIGRAGLLHDVGKIAVPTRVIRKDSKLTFAEYEAVQLHPLRGVELIRSIGFLSETIDGIRHHHERFNGTGYPAGLAGYDIPEFARVLAVVDAFDAMTTVRTYRAAHSREEALEELVAGKGEQFDPTFVDAFVEITERGTYVPDTPPVIYPDDLAGAAMLIDDDGVARSGLLRGDGS